MVRREPTFPEILTRTQWTLIRENHSVTFWRTPEQDTTHHLMKAFLWALYLPDYPTVRIEQSVEDRYKPDVIAIDATAHAYSTHPYLFWGECGQVKHSKLRDLVRRYPDTHFAVAKWRAPLMDYVRVVRSVLHGVRRTAPFDVWCFETRHLQNVTENGHITIHADDVQWQRINT